MGRHFLWPVGVFLLALSGQNTIEAQSLIEPFLTPGRSVSNVRAIVCNTPEQLAAVLSAYSVDYATGLAAFKNQKHTEEYDLAAEQMAPACDEVWFTAIVPVRTISTKPYNVYFADGSRHLRHIIEIKPVGAEGQPAEASYFISSRWKVMSLETAL